MLKGWIHRFITPTVSHLTVLFLAFGLLAFSVIAAARSIGNARVPRRDALDTFADPSAATSVPAPSPGRYVIDAGHSSFVVHASVHGLLSAFGHNHTIAVKDLSGQAVFDPDNPSASSLELRVRAASLTVIDNVKDSDKREIEQTMRDKVLEVSKYPEISFKSTNVSVTKTGEGQYRADMWGELSLHGVTRKGFIRATVAFQGNGFHARGEFPIIQTDYGIQPVSVAGGTIKVKNELKLTFDLAANRQ